MPEHVISPELFELLDDYVALLDAREAIVDDVVPATSPVIVFTENAFAQFFENDIGIQIEGFDDGAKRKAVRARAAKRDELSLQARRLIALFKQFCDHYDDVKSASYGGQETVLEEFHAVLLVRLLQRIRALAKLNDDHDLEQAAGTSLESLKDVVADYDWSDHGGTRYDDE